MKRKYVVLTVAVLGALFLFSACGEGNDTAADADATPDLSDVEGPDVDTVIVTEPGDDFFDHATADWFELSFKGLINKVEEFDTGNTTDGIGEFTFKIDGETLDVGDDPVAFLSQLPDDYPKEEYQGLKYIGLIGTHTIEQGSSSGRLYYLSAGIGQEFLQGLKTAGTPEAAAPAAFWATLYDYSYFVRADQVVLLRFCPISRNDEAAQASTLFVDARANKTFAPGENLIVWGNIAMTPKIEITPDTEAESCMYMMDDADITKEQYDEEIAKDALEFGCELPEDFTTPRYDEYDIFRSRGIVNDGAGTDIATSAAIERTVLVNGTELEVLSYQSAWYAVSSGGTDYVALQSLGNYSSAGDLYHFTIGELYVVQSTLAALKANEETIIENVASQVYYSFSEVDQRVEGDDYLMKQCPVAVADATKTDSALFFCTTGNTEFAVGEYIEAAGNVALTHDPTAIAEYMQYEGCVCYRFPDGGDAVALDCAEFDQ